MLHQITTVIASPECSEKADTEVDKKHISHLLTRGRIQARS